MKLGELDSMFTETFFSENAGEIKEETSVLDLDLDLDIGNLYFSPVPYESSCERAEGLSVAMVASNISVADVFPALGSIKFAEFSESKNGIANNTITTDAVGCIWEADPSGPSTDEGGDTSRCNPPREGDGEAEVVNDIDKLQTPHCPLIVYKSSRRKSVRNKNNKLNKTESQNASRNCRKIAQKNKALDLNSLKISRRRRSLFPKRARSSVWGLLGNMVPDLEENCENDHNVGSDEKLGRVRIAQGKKSDTVKKTGRGSVRKSCHPTGHITLKIKIGNQSCGMLHVTEDLNASKKSTPGVSDITERKFGERFSGDVILPHKRNSKVLSSDFSLATHLDVRGSVENLSCTTLSDLHHIISHEGDKARASTENRSSDPGTSPDSEVINSVPDTTLPEKGIPNVQGTLVIPMERINHKCWTNSVPDVSVANVSSLSLRQKESKKGRKQDKHHEFGECSVLNQLIGANTTSSAKAPVQLEPGGEVVDVSDCNDASIIATANTYLNTYSINSLSKGPSCCSRMADLGTPSTTSEVCNGAEVNYSPELVASVEVSNSQAGDTLIPCSNGQKNFSRCPRTKGQRKSRFEILDITSKKDEVFKMKGDRQIVEIKHQIDEKGGASIGLSEVETHLFAGNRPSSDPGETGYLSKGTSGELNGLQSLSGELRDAPPRNAWVLCDECQKWRRIPATLADQIEETNSGWTCKDNTDIDFADCSIPQEKSNSEINKELEISDAEEDACDALRISNQNRSQAVRQSSSWSLIKSNLFLHRSRKTQTIDEVMVCHCKPPSDGRMGCGAKCLNRMLNIECVRGTCPCGELCSNQQFQKRRYAKLKWFRCGKKGFGLQALDVISQGQFLIEYVGEVLDIRAYEARQKEYALQGHKHFYFMTLNGSEVIDASAKGNLGRFINHSCDPNCRTEKWMVNGEVCVGLFAVRDIKKGEEVTFDYNYVRVFGAAAKKCVCGSPNCRGYIGGDPTNSEGIVQGDSDEEFAEPVVTCEDREMKDDWNDIISNSVRVREKETENEPPVSRDSWKKPVAVAAQLESITSETLTQKVGVDSACGDGFFNMSTARQFLDMVQDDDKPGYSVGNDFEARKDNGESLSISAPTISDVETEGLQTQVDSPVSVQLEDVANKVLSSAQKPPCLEVTPPPLPSKLQHNTIESKRKSKYATPGGNEELAKPDSAVKTRLPPSIKKGKLKPTLVNDKRTLDVERSNVAANKSKSLQDVSLNSHVEAVEKKLNELLNTEGGISKRKDASKGYLKLLFLTAASGTNGHGEAIQSTRDLSMILDALLKTKSQTVLVDIINKNGLQMLHNIMKRYRKEFNKTPILRKLLKVLEYMATREILPLEHITGGPPCPGVESFRDSILALTEHGDRQVHQIARNFRDRWIPRPVRRKCLTEMHDVKEEVPQSSSYGKLSVSSYDHSNDRAGKPAEPIVASGAVGPSLASNCNNGTTETRIRKRKSRWDNPAEENLHSGTKANLSDDVDIPPGFSSPRKDDSGPPGFSSPFNDDSAPPGFSPLVNEDSGPPGFLSPCKKRTVCKEKITCVSPPVGTVLGDLHAKFIASMPVSYGIPYSVMQQFGILKAEGVENLKVAPGLPFHPFPPLPTYKKWDPPTPAAKSGPLSETVEKLERGSNGTCFGYLPGQKRTIAHSMDSDSPKMNTSVNPEFQRDRSSYGLGRKFFRQQKWNHTKQTPPWVRKKNGWGHADNTRYSGPAGVDFLNGANQSRSSYN
ncbi:hypothetical protein OROHE_023619 [Orobanche hederae]